ncbi:hypothetical protein WJX72_002816 [[Myrmecia] bisecta]|uniref:Uncharacterized protein n=1 Tax=[Myrmecia] bisecta TaxID=41462 RepID=A0AAW1PVF2_9CHLO
MGILVQSASTGAAVPLLSLWQAEAGTRCVVPFLTHFADLSSWEYAQKLVKLIPTLQARGVQVVAVGLGSVDNARKFSEILNFPVSLLYADPEGLCYSALGFSKGFGADLDINPYMKLLPMLMGIGSPGTVQEVLRGYVGDRHAKPVFEGQTPFNMLGQGYQRPFELATLRLNNMIGILPKWVELSPPKQELLTQQGGTLVFNGAQTVFRHDDSGILKYTDVYALREVALSGTAALPP